MIFHLLVQKGQDDEHEVPDQQDDSKLPVHPPAVVVGEEDQEDDGSDQDDGRVQETFLQAFKGAEWGQKANYLQI